LADRFPHQLAQSSEGTHDHGRFFLQKINGSTDAIWGAPMRHGRPDALADLTEKHKVSNRSGKLLGRSGIKISTIP